MPVGEIVGVLPELSLQTELFFPSSTREGNMTRCAMLAAAVSLSFSCVTPVFTQELPSEGKFSITYTAVNPAPSKAVSVGDRDVTVSSSIMTGVNDAGSGLLHNMAGRCNFMTETNKVAKTIQTRGFCNYADRAGDQVFEEFATDGPVTLGSPIAFKGTWLGGTGKFEGLSGEFEIRPAAVLVSDVLVQGAGKKTGTYQIKKSPVAQK
jgi:hypothetical protein